jgi:hypothetical protein
VLESGSTGFTDVRIRVPAAAPEKSSFLGLSVSKAHESGTLRARLCGACGHAELFSPEAAQLWAAYRGAS